MKTVCIIIMLLMLQCFCYPQSLSGLTGLFNIPTAEIAGDGVIIGGVNYLERNHLKYAGGEKDVLAPFITIGYLPFVELSLRVTRQLNYTGNTHNVDRMFSGKLRFIEEGEYLPAVALGLHNPYSTEKGANHFNSSYLVATKKFSGSELIGQYKLTIGYGSDIIKAADYQFIGLFGGFSATLLGKVEVMFEYDAERWNAGARLDLFDFIRFYGGWVDLKHFSGGGSIIVRM